MFTCTPYGQVLSSELRELFRGYRKRTGGILVPSYTSNSLPEMACYGPDDCCRLMYGPGSSKTWCPSRRAEFSSFFHEESLFGCFSQHRYERSHYMQYIQQVRTTNHWPWGMETSVCVVTNYETRVKIFDKGEAGQKLNPRRQWFHAMDSDTYPRPALGFEMPLCRDRDCMNYYRRPKNFHCS